MQDKKGLGIPRIPTLNLIDTPAMKMIRDMDKWSNLIMKTSLISPDVFESITEQLRMARLNMLDSSLLINRQLQEVTMATSAIRDMVSKLDFGSITESLRLSLQIDVPKISLPKFDRGVLDSYRKAFEQISRFSTASFWEWGIDDLDANEIQKDVSDFFKEQEEKKNSIIDYVDTSIERFKNSHPLARQLIVYILLPFLINAASTYILPGGSSVTNTYHITNEYHNNREYIKSIQYEMKPQDEFEKLVYYHIRIVASTDLTVFSNRKKKSMRLNTLYLGQKVKVIVKRRNWTYVEYYDESTESYKEGWVLSRYLTKVYYKR